MAVSQNSDSQEDFASLNDGPPAPHSATQVQEAIPVHADVQDSGSAARRKRFKRNWSKHERASAGWHSLCGVFRVALQHVWKMGHPDAVKIAIDCALIAIAAGWTWFVSYSQVPQPGSPLPFMAVVLAARLLIYLPLGLYRHSWLHVSRHEVLWLAISALLGPFVIATLFFVLPEPYTLGALVRPHLILATEPALYLLMLCLARLAARTLYSSGPAHDSSHRLVIIGAGSAGRALSFQIQETRDDYQVVGFVDDDPRLRGRRIRGVPVLGSCQDLAEVAASSQAREIVIAISSLKPQRLREIIALCSETGLPVRMLPPLRELFGKANLRALREVRMEDLLPRPEVKLDRALLSGYLSGKTVLITGGGGSIGGELCRQVLAAGSKRLLVLGRGENSVFEMMQELSEINETLAKATVDTQASPDGAGREGCELVPVICDVRDREGLESVFTQFKPDVVFHAAAHKHVPLMEYYPSEAVKNNVLGTLNVVQLAVEHSVERFVMVSTDKAVDPANVMGATKRIGEMIVKAHAGDCSTDMVCVRFGNVLGSRGSVVPTMTRQIRRGLPVTVTDPGMVRYFMTIPEAVQLVLQAGAAGGHGEVFVLDMGHPVCILDLAYDLIRLSGLVPNEDIPIRIVGVRPGEKMSEDLLSMAETKDAKKSGHFTKAPTQIVDSAAFMSQISQLIAVGKKADNVQCMELIRSIVPEYRAAADLNTPIGPSSEAEPPHDQVQQAELIGDAALFPVNSPAASPGSFAVVESN